MSLAPFSITVAESADRIRKRNATLSAFVSTRLDDALEEANALGGDRASASLAGVPFSLKDEWDTAALPTTGGSHRHRDRRPEQDGTVASAFREAGAVLMGKTNLSDLGLAPEACSYVGGSTKNPYDHRRTSGGSSGGSACAVADRMVAFDWGADIGGSIRLPAAFCGVLGLRLANETWPVDDIFPTPPSGLASMCGQGPFTHTTTEMRAVLDAVSGKLRTGTSHSFEPRGVALYVPEHLGHWPTFEANVRAHLERASGSAVMLSPDLPDTRRMRRVYSAVWCSHFMDLVAADESIELVGGLAGVLRAVVLRGRFGDLRFYPTTAELLALIALGRVTFFRNRETALRDAAEVRDGFRALWDRGLVVAMPVCTYPAPIVGRSNYNPHLLACTVAGNLADATGLAVPFGTFGDLPRAVQLLGPPGSEQALLDMADRLLASFAGS